MKLSKAALQGCIGSVYVNGKAYMLTEMKQSEGATTGCPAGA